MLQTVLRDFKTPPRVPMPPSLLLDRSNNDNTPQRSLYIRNVRPGLPRDTEQRTCGGEGPGERAMKFMKVSTGSGQEARHLDPG
jgi:hypothetical protein